MAEPQKKPSKTYAYGKNGFKYQPKYGVVILCDNENHQQSIYEKLKEQGYKLKVVVV